MSATQNLHVTSVNLLELIVWCSAKEHLVMPKTLTPNRVALVQTHGQSLQRYAGASLVLVVYVEQQNIVRKHYQAVDMDPVQV